MTVRQAFEDVLTEQKAICFQNTSMLLDIVCEQLEAKYGIDARFGGRSVYVNGQRVFSVEVSKEARGCVGLYKWHFVKGIENEIVSCL
jgi:hypothetical protein